jgi:hypothetical protein
VPLFKIVVEGRGVKTVLDDKPAVLGFMATRWVHARDRDAASRQGLALVWTELNARCALQDPERGLPELALEEVSEADEMPAAQPGFVWYPDDEEEAG